MQHGGYYHIPTGSLIPLKIKNLMFAGRIICENPAVFASVRGMPQCMAMGQTSGTAAVLALNGLATVESQSLSSNVYYKGKMEW